MLDYIWLDEKTPILNQLPNRFKFAAILFHPFIKMPFEWGKERSSDDGIYPSNEEILDYGYPVTWQEIMSDNGLTSHDEVALALKTSIHALRKEYAREDLASKLNSNLKPEIYYPTEDNTSVFILDNFLRLFSAKGIKELCFSDPLLGRNGVLNINGTTPLDICDLADNELILTDMDMNYAFMNLHDSFTTLFFTTDEDIKGFLRSANCEFIVCDGQTGVNWYWNSQSQ
ncbi:Protein of unknown function [Thermoactinomyces sp. DSM 45891]|uniref:DUF2711 family protein n=1 Tax=Thermoactinomyces sp. DSM 45891 TaxID=1761907 RepID=UPI00091022DE|nr:DUF2711 family protein [Thermoactinomyces sp. DSM 45891]SFX83981.1 Protein of unknown function [Thermoactinomyces sp. DSM 45891]SFX84178.1 Protein of unknown function [Thermoactinomyces sp. DSM 45891]